MALMPTLAARMLGYYAVLNGVYLLIPSAGVINVLALANRARGPALTTPFQLVGWSADSGQTEARVEVER